MYCVSIKPKNHQELLQQAELAEKKADLLEIRVNGMDSIDKETLKKIIQQRSVPILLTFRSTKQKSQKEAEEVLRMLASVQPTYLDVEHDMPQAFIEDLRKEYPHLSLVLSYHNFKETPKNLSEILEEMRRIPNVIYKIVTTAQNTLDALRMLVFAKEVENDVIAFAMGEEGIITRILGPLVGNRWTYAALSEDQKTAPGQLPVDELRNNYNYDKLNPQTKICGLIGYPLKANKNHLIHNVVYNRLDIEAIYVKMRITPDDLEKYLSLVKRLDIRGLSVTMPLKEAIQPYLDEISSLAIRIGAVNTLTFSRDGISGTNTDAGGALDALEQHSPVANKTMVILGAGGAARAVAYEAKRRGAQVIVLARREEQSQQLAHDLSVEGKALSSLSEIEYDILVNATPSEMPINEELIIPKTVVMDLKTKPRNTSLLLAAVKRNCLCVYGADMFVRQAVGQLQAWFDKDLDEKTILQAYQDEYQKR